MIPSTRKNAFRRSVDRSTTASARPAARAVRHMQFRLCAHAHRDIRRLSPGQSPGTPPAPPGSALGFHNGIPAAEAVLLFPLLFWGSAWASPWASAGASPWNPQLWHWPVNCGSHNLWILCHCGALGQSGSHAAGAASHAVIRSSVSAGHRPSITLAHEHWQSQEVRRPCAGTCRHPHPQKNWSASGVLQSFRHSAFSTRCRVDSTVSSGVQWFQGFSSSFLCQGCINLRRVLLLLDSASCHAV